MGYIILTVFENTDSHNEKTSSFEFFPSSNTSFENIGAKTIELAETTIPTKGISSEPLAKSANTSFPKYLLIKN